MQLHNCTENALNSKIVQRARSRISVRVQEMATILGFGVVPGAEDQAEQQIGDLFKSPWDVLTLGLAAAVGEESLFRAQQRRSVGVDGDGRRARAGLAEDSMQRDDVDDRACHI